MSQISADYDTVIVGTIEAAGMGGEGGFHRRWFLHIRVDEQSCGAPLPKPAIVLYIHSPVQEFPELITGRPGDGDYTAPLIGTRWRWALKTRGTVIETFRRLPLV